ncbi:MAG: FliH/SctL family protein [Verrucomicrobiota bacterium]
MPLFNIVLPKPLAKVAIRKTKSADAATEEAYRKGHEAGYKAGQLQAQLELRQQKKKNAEEAAEWIRQLESAHEELVKIAGQHIPQLVLAALSRVLQHHKFTDEEIQHEVTALLQELSLAKSISIECSRADMDSLQEYLNSAGTSVTQSTIQWTPNDALQKGEYVIQSDLGVLDGRRSTRMAHVHAALKQIL